MAEANREFTRAKDQEEMERKQKEANDEHGQNVIEGLSREVTREDDSWDGLVAENNGDGTMSDELSPMEKEALKDLNDMKGVYVLGNEADAKEYIDANYSEEKKETMHKLLDAEKKKWHENEKTPEGRARNRELKNEYSGKQQTGSNNNPSGSETNEISIPLESPLKQEDLKGIAKHYSVSCVLASTTILTAAELGRPISMPESYQKARAAGAVTEGMDVTSSKIGPALGFDKALTIQTVSPGSNEMQKTIDNRLQKGKLTAVYLQSPGSSGKHMEVINGTSTFKGKKVYTLHDVGFQGDKYMEPDTGKVFKLNSKGDQEYTKIKNSKGPRRAVELWYYK